MKKYIISLAAVAMAASMTTAAMAAEGKSEYFVDVNPENYGWAAEYIDYIAKNGIASGVGNNMYEPGSNIIRGDFAVLVNKTFTFKEAKLATYSLKDVSEDSYYAQAIANCCGAGVITERGMFYPESDITRIDAIVMIYRALNNNNLLGGTISTDTSVFTDGSLLTTVERQMAAATLNKLGIINGDDTGALNPQATMTRAEMAVVFAKLDQYIDNYTEETNKKAEEEAAKKAEEEAKKAEEEQEQSKSEETGSYSNETLDSTVKATSGGTVSIDSSTVKTTSENGVTIDNGSTASIKNSNITSVGGSGVSVNNESTVSTEGGSVNATNGIALSVAAKSTVDMYGTDINAEGNSPKYAVNIDDSTVNFENGEINAGDSVGAVKIGGGGTINIKDSEVTAKTGSGKSTYEGTINVVSDSSDVNTINIEDSTISNGTGAAFYVTSGNTEINLKGTNTISAGILVSTAKDKENKDNETTTTLNIEGKTYIQDTRIVLDNNATLNLNLGDGAQIAGQFDTDNVGTINLYMEQGATLELLSDLYVDEFVDGNNYDYSNIWDNGYNIYYNMNNQNNDWLEIKEHDLSSGGKLIPYSK